MKTKFFKNGFGAKLMLAALAMVGTMFTSCEEEDVDTVFNPGPATVEITASVYDPVNMEFVTDRAQISGTGVTKYEKGVPAGTTATVTASYNGQTASETIVLNKLAMGGYAVYHVNLVLNGVRPGPDPVDPTDDGHVLEATSSTETVVRYSTPNAQSHAHSHDGGIWFENATEYFYPWTVTFDASDVITCVKKDLSGLKAENGDKAAYEALINEMCTAKEATGEISWKASAWSLSRAKVTYVIKTTEYLIKGNVTGKVAGSFTLVEKFASSQAEAEEIAHPSHASHWNYGHGHASHDHGHGSENAGGGIVIAD